MGAWSNVVVLVCLMCAASALPTLTTSEGSEVIYDGMVSSSSSPAHPPTLDIPAHSAHPSDQHAGAPPPPPSPASIQMDPTPSATSESDSSNPAPAPTTPKFSALPSSSSSRDSDAAPVAPVPVSLPATAPPPPPAASPPLDVAVLKDPANLMPSEMEANGAPPAPPTPVAPPPLVTASLSENEGRYWIVRVLGNDMPPLQGQGQTFQNLRYVLENEPRFPNSKRLFIVNRIVDAGEERRILDLLESHSDVLVMHQPLEWDQLPADEGEWLHFVTSVNGARNAGMNRAFSEGAEWVLMNDGNTFVTTPLFESVVAASQNPEVKYVSAPHVRLIAEQSTSWLSGDTTRDQLLSEHHVGEEIQEGAISFRRDAPEWFDESLKYGDRDKWDLLEHQCGGGQPDRVDAGAVPGSCVLVHEAAVRMWSYPPTDEAVQAINDVMVRGPLRAVAGDTLKAAIREMKSHRSA